MRINNNLMAMNTHRQYAINNDNVSKSTEKLSSGYRINRAGDDAAGLAISEKMRAQIRGLNMASKNSQDAISMIQTAEGALTETHSILQRMSELATQSASDTNQSGSGGVDRDALDLEFQALKSEVDDIAGKTTFNNMSLLNGSLGATATITAGSNIQLGALGTTEIKLEGFAAGNGQTISFALSSGAGSDYNVAYDRDGASTTYSAVTISGVDNTSGVKTLTVDFGGNQKLSMTFTGAADTLDGRSITFDVAQGAALIQSGANAGETLAISIGDMRTAALGINASDIKTQASASTAMTSVKNAINTVSTQRAQLGAFQNRLQHKINNLDTASENLSAAESRIRDLDMASEMTTYSKNNILVQAATAMLAQANSAPQQVLNLLK